MIRLAFPLLTQAITKGSENLETSNSLGS